MTEEYAKRMQAAWDTACIERYSDDITIVTMDLLTTKVPGEIVKDGDTGHKTIVVNARMASEHWLNTALHELGHDERGELDRDDLNVNQVEYEAHYVYDVEPAVEPEPVPVVVEEQPPKPVIYIPKPGMTIEDYLTKDERQLELEAGKREILREATGKGFFEWIEWFCSEEVKQKFKDLKMKVGDEKEC